MEKLKIILKIVSDYYETPIGAIIERSRKREIVEKRQMTQKLAREFTDLTLGDIGLYIGGVDHATVLHSTRTIDDLIYYNRKISADYAFLHNKIDTFLKVNIRDIGYFKARNIVASRSAAIRNKIPMNVIIS